MEIPKSEQVVLNKTEKPNSYEFGKAGNRFKLYFETNKELYEKIKELVDMKLAEWPTLL